MPPVANANAAADAFNVKVTKLCSTPLSVVLDDGNSRDGKTFKLWYDALHQRIGVLTGASAWLDDTTTEVPRAAAPAMGEQPAHTPAQHFQTSVRGLMRLSIKPECRAWRVIEACPHASGLCAGALQAIAVLKQHYQMDDHKPSKGESLDMLYDCKQWPKKVGRDEWQAFASKVTSYAQDADMYPVGNTRDERRSVER